MRISELAARSGASVPTVKYYLREGLLHPGVAVSARETAFDDTHLARVRLIRGLVHVLGASINQVREVLDVIAEPGQTVVQAMGRATSALPAAGHLPDAATPEGEVVAATALLERLGLDYEPESSAVQQLDAALRLAERVGVPVDDAQIRVYGEAARAVAAADFARIPWGDADAALEFAVLGTALYEPVLLALRRIAHYEQGIRMREEHEDGAGPAPQPKESDHEQ